MIYMCIHNTYNHSTYNIQISIILERQLCWHSQVIFHLFFFFKSPLPKGQKAARYAFKLSLEGHMYFFVIIHNLQIIKNLWGKPFPGANTSTSEFTA